MSRLVLSSAISHILLVGEKDLASLCLSVAISKRIADLAGEKSMGFQLLMKYFRMKKEAKFNELAIR